MSCGIHYKKIIPYFLDNIFDINKNENYFLPFTEDMYNYIMYLNYNDINKWSKYEKLTEILNNDEFNTIKYNNNNISYLPISNYINDNDNNTYPMRFIIKKNEITAILMSYTSLLYKINHNRYISFIIRIIRNKKDDHICNLIFDNYNNECYIIELNGKIKKDIHKIMEYYTSNTRYKYKILEKEKILLNLNNKIKSSKQKQFFSGYCMGWGLYFKYLSEKAPDDFNMKDYLKILSLYKNKGPLFQLIETFQVWFYLLYTS
jgi:hypothetical protein